MNVAPLRTLSKAQWDDIRAYWAKAFEEESMADLNEQSATGLAKQVAAAWVDTGPVRYTGIAAPQGPHVYGQPLSSIPVAPHRHELEAERDEARLEAAKWETIASGHRRDLEALQAENKKLKEDMDLLRVAMAVMIDAQERTSVKLSKPDNSKGARLSRAMDAMHAKPTMGLSAGGDRY